MKEFQLTPAEWRGLSRIDRLALHYHRVMESHYLDRMQEEGKRERERDEARRRLMDTLPKQIRRGR